MSSSSSRCRRVSLSRQPVSSQSDDNNFAVIPFMCKLCLTLPAPILGDYNSLVVVWCVHQEFRQQTTILNLWTNSNFVLARNVLTPLVCTPFHANRASGCAATCHTHTYVIRLKRACIFYTLLESSSSAIMICLNYAFEFNVCALCTLCCGRKPVRCDDNIRRVLAARGRWRRRRMRYSTLIWKKREKKREREK